MSVRSGRDQIDRKAVVRMRKHVERFAEAEVAHDVKSEVIGLVGDINRGSEVLGGMRGHRIGILRMRGGFGVSSEVCAELSNMREDVILHGLDRSVGESLAQHSSLPGVDSLVDGRVCRKCVLRCPERLVEFGLLDIGLKAVNLLQCCVRVERNGIRAKSIDRSIFLMVSPELQMSVAFEGMICAVEVGNLREKWSRILRERMEPDAVDCKAECIDGESNGQKSQQIEGKLACQVLERHGTDRVWRASREKEKGREGLHRRCEPPWLYGMLCCAVSRDT